MKKIFFGFCFWICGILFFGLKQVKAFEIASFRVMIFDYQCVSLEWQSDSPDTVYRIEKKKPKDLDYTVLTTLSGHAGFVCCYDQAVKMGETYVYRIVETQNGVASAWSESIPVTIVLPSPKMLKAKKISNSRIQLTWGTVHGATGYEVYRSTKKDKNYKKIGTTKSRKFLDSNLKKGKTYYYKVVATYKKKKAYSSAKSESASVYVKLTAPLVVGNYSKQYIKLTWSKVKGADLYAVYKKNSKGKYVKVKETKKLYYKDDKVKKGKYYHYKVVALDLVKGKMKKGEYSSSCKVLASAIDPNKKMVAITYDDGPSIYTKDILQTLKDNDAKATFFVLGCNVDAHKEALIVADTMGCEIGNHTMNHYDLTRLSVEEIKKEMDDTEKKIYKYIGKKTTIMRPPGGSLSDEVEVSVGKPIILWSIDTRDWENRNSSRIVSIVTRYVRDGDIVLMHDIYSSTRDASRILIPQLRRQGYQLVTVSDLAYYRGYTMKKGSVYRNLRKQE